MEGVKSSFGIPTHGAGLVPKMLEKPDPNRIPGVEE